MKILLVGAGGTLGGAVGAALAARHEVIEASRTGRHTVDLTDPASIGVLLDEVGPVEAIACAAGVTPFASLAELTREQYLAGITSKLLGQIELVRQGIPRLPDGASFTLISGVLSDDPIVTGSVAATVNGAVNAFVKAAAIELPRGMRINAVSPTVVTESWDSYGDFFPGYAAVPVAEVGRAFVKSIEGAQTGQVYRVGH